VPLPPAVIGKVENIRPGGAQIAVVDRDGVQRYAAIAGGLDRRGLRRGEAGATGEDGAGLAAPLGPGVDESIKGPVAASIETTPALFFSSCCAGLFGVASVLFCAGPSALLLAGPAGGTSSRARFISMSCCARAALRAMMRRPGRQCPSSPT
jgi:hypothetical protein